MKIELSFLALIALVTLSCSPIEPNVAGEEKYTFTNDSISILEVLNKQQEAWNQGSIEDFMKGYEKSEELTFIGSRGVTYGWENTLNNYKKGYPDLDAMGKLSFNIISLKSLDNNSAQVIGQFILDRKDDQPTGFFSLIFQKLEGNWLITSDMTASTPQE